MVFIVRVFFLFVCLFVYTRFFLGNTFHKKLSLFIIVSTFDDQKKDQETTTLFSTEVWTSSLCAQLYSDFPP